MLFVRKVLSFLLTMISEYGSIDTFYLPTDH
jgi:hypothetical protein